MSKLHPWLSILLALTLALFEFFFFFQVSGVEEAVWTVCTRSPWVHLGVITLVYLSFQLLTIPLAVGGRERFIGVVDGIARCRCAHRFALFTWRLNRLSLPCLFSSGPTAMAPIRTRCAHHTHVSAPFFSD
jgi:hypothetical protein